MYDRGGCHVFFSFLRYFPEVDVHLVLYTSPPTVLLFLFLPKRRTAFLVAWALYGASVIDQKRLLHLPALLLLCDHPTRDLPNLQMNVFRLSNQLTNVSLWLF
jgi:hypothetical protein